MKASYHSIRGRIASEWQRDGGRFTLRASIPAGTTATVYLPAKSLDNVTESGRPAQQSAGVKYLRQENGRVVFAVDSGEYAFEAR